LYFNWFYGTTARTESEKVKRKPEQNSTPMNPLVRVKWALKKRVCLKDGRAVEVHAYLFMPVPSSPPQIHAMIYGARDM
jgi:hypothetical protein